MRILGLLILITSSQISLAQQSSNLNGCEGPDTSTYFESCILSKETADLELKLNQKYKELIRDAPSFSPSAKKALIESQRAWLRYRNSTCNFQQSFLGGINSINWVRCNNALTAERFKYFESF